MHADTRDGSPARLLSHEVGALKHDAAVLMITAALVAAIGLGVYALGHWQGLRQRDWVENLWALPDDAGWEQIDPESELGSRLVELVANNDSHYPYYGPHFGPARRKRVTLEWLIDRRLSELSGDVSARGWRPYEDRFGRYVVCYEFDYSGTDYKPRWLYEADLDTGIVEHRWTAEGRRTEGNVFGGYFALMLLLLEAVFVLGWQWLVLRRWDGTRDILRAMPKLSPRARRGVSILPFPFRCPR